MAHPRYRVRSEDGTAYNVGVWRDGVYHPGTAADAVRELALLRQQEPRAFIEVTPDRGGSDEGTGRSVRPKA